MSNGPGESMGNNLVDRADESTGHLLSVLSAGIEAWVELCLERSEEASWGTTYAAKEKLS